MKIPKVLDREHFEKLPDPMKQIVMGLQMHDPDTLKYLLTLALVALHERGGMLSIDQESMERVGGEGVLSLMFDDEPPTLDVAFLPGDPERLFNEVFERRKEHGHSPDDTLSIDVRDVGKGKPQ